MSPAAMLADAVAFSADAVALDGPAPAVHHAAAGEAAVVAPHGRNAAAVDAAAVDAAPVTNDAAPAAAVANCAAADSHSVVGHVVARQQVLVLLALALTEPESTTQI